MAEEKFANERLTDEQLDDVAGGSCSEMADDSRFLNSLNNSTDRYGEVTMYFQDRKEEIKKGWATVGITAELTNALVGGNKYFLNGQQITQEQARQHAMNVVGKQMKESDWNW